jgi:hypothetical protein
MLLSPLPILRATSDTRYIRLLWRCLPPSVMPHALLSPLMHFVRRTGNSLVLLILRPRTASYVHGFQYAERTVPALSSVFSTQVKLWPRKPRRPNGTRAAVDFGNQTALIQQWQVAVEGFSGTFGPGSYLQDPGSQGRGRHSSCLSRSAGNPRGIRLTTSQNRVKVCASPGVSPPGSSPPQP